MVSILISLLISMFTTIMLKVLAVKFAFLQGWLIPSYVVFFVLLLFFIGTLSGEVWKKFKD